MIEIQNLCSQESKIFPFYEERTHAKKQKQNDFLGISATGSLYRCGSWAGQTTLVISLLEAGTRAFKLVGDLPATHTS